MAASNKMLHDPTKAAQNVANSATGAAGAVTATPLTNKPQNTSGTIRVQTGPKDTSDRAADTIRNAFATDPELVAGGKQTIYNAADTQGKLAMQGAGTSPNTPQINPEVRNAYEQRFLNPDDTYNQYFGQGAGLIGQGADALSGMLGNYGGSGISAGNVSGGGMQVGAERVGTQDVLGQMRDDYGLLSGQYGGILSNEDPLWQDRVDHQMRRLQEQQEAERNRLGGAMAASGLGGSAIGIGAGIQSENAYQDAQMQALLDIADQEMQNRLAAGGLYNQAFGQMGGMEEAQAGRFLTGDISNQQAALEASIANQSDITRRNLADQEAQLRAQIENEANNLMARGQDITGATNLGGLGANMGNLAQAMGNTWANNTNALTNQYRTMGGMDIDMAGFEHGVTMDYNDLLRQDEAQKLEHEMALAGAKGNMKPIVDSTGNITPQSILESGNIVGWADQYGGIDNLIAQINFGDNPRQIQQIRDLYYMQGGK